MPSPPTSPSDRHPARPSRFTTVRGFTLSELVVTIAIVAIVAAIALPGFRETFQSNRVASATNELIASLSYARGEAIRSNLGNGAQTAAAICASNDGAACGGNWNDGWIVFRDDNLDGNPQAGEVLRYVVPTANIQIDSANDRFAFDNRGRRLPPASPDPPIGFLIRPGDCKAGSPFQRTLTVGATGQARFVRQDCP